MKDAITQYRPASSWISAALITLFVISFALIAEAHVETPTGDHMVTEFCTGSSDSTNRFFIKYH